MIAYLIRRIWQMIPTLLGVVLLVFFLFNWVGGDPAYVLAGKMASPEDIANIRHQLGIDRPLWEQLWIFIRQIVSGDFGDSWSTHEPVSQIFRTRLGPSMTLLIPLMILETAVAVLMALLVSAFRGSLLDRSLMVASTMVMSISLLVYIIVGQYVFASVLGWFPVKGWSQQLSQNLTTYAVLPVLLGLLVSVAPSLRLYRTFILDEVGQDYVRTARAKGASNSRVLFRHSLRNALIPIVTILGLTLPGLFGGALITETLFNYPGMGLITVQAVQNNDVNTVMAATLLIALMTITGNLLADLGLSFVDPRVRLGGKS